MLIFFWQNGTHATSLSLTELTNCSAYCRKTHLERTGQFFPFRTHLGVIFPHVKYVSSCLIPIKTPGLQIPKPARQIPSAHQPHRGPLAWGGQTVECLPESIPHFIFFHWTMFIRERWSVNFCYFSYCMVNSHLIPNHCVHHLLQKWMETMSLNYGYQTFMGTQMCFYQGKYRQPLFISEHEYSCWFW